MVYRVGFREVRRNSYDHSSLVFDIQLGQLGHMRMKINTAEECQRAEAAVWKALSAIHARQRWLKWCAEVDSLTCHGTQPAIRRAEKFRRAAEEKTREDLDDFRKLKEWADGCCGSSDAARREVTVFHRLHGKRYAAMGVAQAIREGRLHERIEQHKREARGIYYLD